MLLRAAIWAAWLTTAGVLAQVSFTNNEFYIYANEPFTITWTNARAPVTVTLMTGPDENLQPVLVIVSGYSGSEYTWTPPPTLASGSYELEVDDGGSADYSPRFSYPATPLPSSSTIPGGNATSTESGPSPTSPAQSNTTTTTPNPPPPASATNSPPTGSSSSQALSTPAIIAISTLGALLFLAVLALLSYCLLTKRRRRRQRAELEQHQRQQQEGYDGGGGGGRGAGLSTTFSHELPLSTLVSSSTTGAGSPRSTTVAGTPLYSPKHGGWVNNNRMDGHQNAYGRAELPVRGWAGDVVELPSTTTREVVPEEEGGFGERDSYEEDEEEEGQEGGGQGWERRREREEWERGRRGQDDIGLAQ